MTYRDEPSPGEPAPDRPDPDRGPAGAVGGWAVMSPGSLAAPVPADTTAAPDDDLFDTDHDAFARPRRTNGWTMLLLAGLIAVVGFGGGVLVQKGHDTGLVSAGGVPSAFRARSGSGGLPTGGFPGGAGPSGFPGAAADSGFPGAAADSDSAADPGRAGNADSAAATGSTRSDAAPAVVGTVTAVSAGRITVTNFGGKAVTVAITATTTITMTGTTSLTTGLSASVVGARSADGTVTATAIMARRRTS